MIPRLYAPVVFPSDPLSAALGWPISFQEPLPDATLIGCGIGPDHVIRDGDQWTWTWARCSEYLDSSTRYFGSPELPAKTRPHFLRASIHMHPQDRIPTRAERTEIVHRLARAAGISAGSGYGRCPWIGAQRYAGRIDLVTNLYQWDGKWRAPLRQQGRLMAQECRRIESDLGLVSPGAPSPSARLSTHDVLAPSDGAPQEGAETAAQIGSALRQLADERTGPLASVRGLIEQAAHRLDAHPRIRASGAGHSLELIAHRLDTLQRDLATAATSLSPTSRPAVVPPTPRTSQAPARPHR